MEILTAEDKAQLTAFNAVAHDILRVEAAREGKLIPPWLILNEESREEGRRKALEVIRKLRLSRSPRLTLAEAAKIAADSLPIATLERWIAAEAMAKKARSEGDPGAFFI